MKQPKTKKYNLRAKLGISLFLLLALLSAFRALKESSFFIPLLPPAGNDGTTSFVNRFKELKDDLPQQETVGYITDIPSEQAGLFGAEYFMTQYALAPILVDSNNNHPLVIGNFHQPDYSNITFGKRLLLRQDFGNGIVLFNYPE